MESGTNGDVPTERVGYLDALKIVALPMASIGGIGAVILWFAADAWVRNIVQDEVAGIVTGNSEASELLTQYGSKLEVHERDIGVNKDDIDEVDDKFTDFVRQVIAKL